MRSGVDLSLTAILVSALLTGSAVAQTSGQTVNPGTGDSGNTVQAGNGKDTAAPDNGGTAAVSAAIQERLSDGTLAESANTTALATSTYHQPTGWLPGMRP